MPEIASYIFCFDEHDIVVEKKQEFWIECIISTSPFFLSNFHYGVSKISQGPASALELQSQKKYLQHLVLMISL